MARQRIRNGLVMDIYQPETSCVVLLPKALRHLHGVPGESGLSPYEVVFGRHRLLKCLLHQPLREAKGALDFIERMQQFDQRVRNSLNELHAKRWAQVKSKRREAPPFEVSAKV